MDNVIENKSFQFAIRIVRLYKFLCEEKKEYILSKQLLRAGTSIGANVTESQQAQSKPDFVSKISIALKEASETKYWIKLLGATEYLSENQTNSILDDCVEIEKIFIDRNLFDFCKLIIYGVAVNKGFLSNPLNTSVIL